MKVNKKRIFKLGIILIISFVVLYVVIKYWELNTKKYCEEITGVNRYEMFSKSADPIKEEYTTKKMLLQCLTARNILYRFKTNAITTKCSQEANNKTGGKSNMLFPISKEDWYLYKGSSDYNGFATYKEVQEIECLKKSRT